MQSKQPTWKPSNDDVVNVLLDQSPWQINGKVPAAWAFDVERPLAKFLWNRLKQDKPRRYQLILGPRRVGKTTAMYQTIRRLLAAKVDNTRVWRLSLDHPYLMGIPLETIVDLVIKSSRATIEKPAYLFLDEVVYASQWDLWLKTFYDDVRPVCITASSSSTAALREGRLESGVGRWDEQYLTPYLFSEYLCLVNEPNEIKVESSLANTIAGLATHPFNFEQLAARRRKYVLTGGFPELLIDASKANEDEQTMLLKSQRTLRNDAVERAIYKDIPHAFGVDNPLLLEKMLYTLAGQVAGLLSPITLCKKLENLSQPTFDRYLSYLERAFLVFTLPNYSGSESSKQRRGRKLYFVDGAVRNAALQRGLAPMSDDTEMGLYVENLVAGHLFALSQQNQVRLYHWRDKEEEVDLVYDHPTEPMAFEVASKNHKRRGVLSFMDRYPKFKGRCYMISEHVPFVMPEKQFDGVGTIPLDAFLLAVSTQAEKGLQTNLLA